MYSSKLLKGEIGWGRHDRYLCPVSDQVMGKTINVQNCPYLMQSNSYHN